MDGLTAEQERRAQDIARNTGWRIDVVREIVATGDGDPGCIREKAAAQPAR